MQDESAHMILEFRMQAQITRLNTGDCNLVGFGAETTCTLIGLELFCRHLGRWEGGRFRTVSVPSRAKLHRQALYTDFETYLGNAACTWCLHCWSL